MGSTKRLKSVVHSIADHAISGVCDLHPDLGKTCAEYGVSGIRLEMVKPGISVPDFPVNADLARGFRILKGHLVRILAAENHTLEDLSSANVTLFHLKMDEDEAWPTLCRAELLGTDGKQFRCWKGVKFSSYKKIHSVDEGYLEEYNLHKELQEDLGNEPVIYIEEVEHWNWRGKGQASDVS